MDLSLSYPTNDYSQGEHVWKNIQKNIDLLDNETKPRHLKENIFDSMKIEPVEIGITIIVGYDI